MTSPSLRPAAFLDRDGVLVEDVDFVAHPRQLRVLPGVPQALIRLRAAGYRLIVVTNQPVVARGWASEDDVAAIHRVLAAHLRQAGAMIDGWYFCPHHPEATDRRYRLDCDCRKPLPGLLRRAATDHQLSLGASVMIGDRLTDVAAGAAAGCRTVWVQTGRHLDPLIRTRHALPANLAADQVCADLPAAVDWWLATKSRERAA